MNILFLSYWSYHEGLTQATVLPHIEILCREKKVDKLILCTIERQDISKVDETHPKVIFIPLISRYGKYRIINKLYDFITFPRQLSQIIKNEKIDLLIARGAPAGSLAYLTFKKTKTPFIVESFEPHADYMLESGVWKKNSLSFQLEKHWERQQLKYAKNILCVSNSYKNELSKVINSQKIVYAPCAVDPDKFLFTETARFEIRNQLGFNQHDKVGIYVGKFGGLYLQDEAFELFRKFLTQNSTHKLIILTPDVERITLVMMENKTSFQNLVIKNVTHSQVPSYLSASDFAFALYKASQSKKALSPIKIGEYWANGLPILIPENIGDDSEIIIQNNIGSRLDISEMDGSIEKFLQLVNSHKREEWVKIIFPFAEKYRSFEINKSVYRQILSAY